MAALAVDADPAPAERFGRVALRPPPALGFAGPREGLLSEEVLLLETALGPSVRLLARPPGRLSDIANRWRDSFGKIERGTIKE